MGQQRFSERLGIGRPDTGLVLNDVPQGLRDALGALFANLGFWHQEALTAYARGELDVPALDLNRFVQRESWDRILDLCEVMHDYFAIRPAVLTSDSSSFPDWLNTRLLRYYSAYVMDEHGRIVEQGSGPAGAATAEARALLRDKRFEGPDRQFQEAVIAFNRRPDPSYENAVANALNAVEGVARILLADPKIMLGQATQRLQDKYNLHPTLADSIANFYGYASDVAGRHGVVGAAQVNHAIAEFCLHQAAATIVLLARLDNPEIEVARPGVS